MMLGDRGEFKAGKKRRRETAENLCKGGRTVRGGDSRRKQAKGGTGIHN